ncbi:MAG: hypothetical protein WBX25_03005 [Rhodomicrobium sp.]
MLPRLAAYLGQPFCYDEGGVVGLKGGRQIALSTKHVADLFLGDGQVALPSGVAWVRLGQPFCYGETFLINAQSPGEIPPLDMKIANLIASPERMPGELALFWRMLKHADDVKRKRRSARIRDDCSTLKCGLEKGKP